MSLRRWPCKLLCLWDGWHWLPRRLAGVPEWLLLIRLRVMPGELLCLALRILRGRRQRPWRREVFVAHKLTLCHGSHIFEGQIRV